MQKVLRALRTHRPQLGRGFLLMLDFDGVLAPIVARPASARMSARTRALLKACARRGRVAVISGRALKDVLRRVGVRELWYAGNHGAQWRMGNVRGSARISRAERSALRSALRACTKLSREYAGVVMEDKDLTFSVHFRRLSPGEVARFRRGIRRIGRTYARTLDISEGVYTFNVRPKNGRTKGDAVRLARKCVPKHFVPIYVGDDTTDEDAFKALPGGITIRVGARRGSAARFVLKRRADVDTILAILARL